MTPDKQPSGCKHLSTENEKKITRFDRNEYGGLTGISQYISILNK